MSNVVSLPTQASFDPNIKPPDFIIPVNLASLSDEHIDTMLESIRTRRLVAQHRFNDSKRLRNQAEVNKLSLRYDKVMHTMAKELDKFDKFIAKFDKAANDLRALRLQLGADPL